MNEHENDVVQDDSRLSKIDQYFHDKKKRKTKSFTRMELSDSLLYNKELFSKHVSIDDEDESVNDGEFIIDAGRSRVTVPVCLCQ